MPISICAVVFLDILTFGMLIPVITPLVRQFTSQALTADVGEQGFIIGANQAIGSLATILSPILAGLTFDRLGSGAPYWTGAILLAVAMLMMFNDRLVKSHHLS